jgi:transposase
VATHKTDRNDARGLMHLARTGFFKPVQVKSLAAHAVRALIIARKKLVGQRLENQIRGLAVVFGIRLPRGLSPSITTLPSRSTTQMCVSFIETSNPEKYPMTALLFALGSRSYRTP